MTTRRTARYLLILMVSLLALAPHAGHVTTAAATSLAFTVNSTVDAPDVNPGDGICADAAGKCTLRAAIQEADAQPSGSSISIRVPTDTYRLTLGTLMLTANAIAISGALSSTTIISGNDTSTVMSISRTVQASISQVTLTGGTAQYGGGIQNQGATVLSQSAILSNTAFSGGGIYNGSHGRLSLVGSTLSANVAYIGPGGGIFNSTGTVSVTRSTLSGNTAYQLGGGICNGNGTLTVTASTLSNNAATYYGFGGGIFNGSGTVSVTRSALRNNSATYGAGIENFNPAGSITVTNSTLSDNTAAGVGGGINNPNGTMTVIGSILSGNVGGSFGGGIDNGATLSLTTSTLSGNSAQYGGGIHNEGPATVTNSTFSGNSATYGGGGIDSYHGPLTVVNSTVSGNSAPFGGGIYSSGSSGDIGTVMLSYDTIASNSDGIYTDVSSTVAVTGSIVANSTSGPNCNNPLTQANGYNLDSGTSCGFSQTTDITNTDPLLGPLANNGGPTQTMALLSGSPAIDHGGTSATGCPATDQRGMPRPDEAKDSGACDIGAYEAQGIG